ncbi:MAG: sodium-translocating pyrophosphatase, partial [Bacteroidetes Order II. Incertae sedis bacterium]|nr:sodium-translocating pyrophosphatase [Bacteroidetes Order II. bacterium]
MDISTLTYLVPVAGVIALLYAYTRAKWVGKQDPGTELMVELADAIAEGARAFLRQEYRVLFVFVIVVAVLLAFANASQPESSWMISVSFIVGAFCSALAGFVGMTVATKANVRTTQAARTGLAPALNVAFSGGLVMGLSVVGLGVLGLGSLFIAYDTMTVWNITKIVGVISGFSLGASSIALFARVGGGIYTKAADVGADLAGKVYEGIPEDDPRNPATIADNVGDNVGDVAGMGADLFESYVGSIIGTMVLGTAFISVPAMSSSAYGELSPILLPLVLAGVGILVSIAGSFFVKTKEGGNPQHALNVGEFGAAGFMAVMAYFIITMMLPESWSVAGTDYTAMGVFYAVLIGLAAGTIIGLVTEYYTATDKGPVTGIARQSVTGSATNIIA